MKTVRYVIASGSTPRIAVRVAHGIGQQFKSAGGTYYRIGEPHETKSLRFAVWVELRGTKTVLDWFEPKTPRV